MSAATKALLVEGRDDKHVIWCLLEHHNFPQVFDVLDKDGVENVLKILPVQLKQSGLSSLGVVLDADADVAGRWEAIKTILKNAGYDPVPAAPESGGTILEQGDMPRVGVWLMPDNTLPGMLEDFVACLVPEGDQVLPVAQDAVNKAASIPAPFKEVHKTKALIHTWLAWQEDPGTPFGQAITKKYLNPEAKSATDFLDWLDGLFVQ